jgi:hypothetical protein
MECTVRLAAEDAFELLCDFRVHERWVPFTTITAPAGPLVPGDLVVAVTAGFFTDRMRVVERVPPTPSAPGVLRVRKEGPALLGDAVIHVTATGGDTSLVRWTGDLSLAGPLPRAVTSAVLAPVYAGMLALAGRGIRRDTEALARVRDRRAGPPGD